MSNLKALTDTQRKTLEAVAVYVQEHGYPPTLTELAERVGVASSNAVRAHLDQLEKKGYIMRGKGAARALRIVSEPAA